MSWVAASCRIALTVLFFAVLGAIFGHAAEFALLALSAIMVFWLYQLHRVQAWIAEPGKSTPEAHGVWGDLFARIRQQQRRFTETQARLQSTVEYLQHSFAAMRDGVVIVDQQGGIEWLNVAAEALLGLRYPEDRGQALTNLVRAPEFTGYLLARDYSVPLQYVHASNARKLHLRVEITYFGEGDRLIFVRDVSAAVQTEQMRRDFVANVSHELRTPLTVITGYLGTILSSTDDLPPRYVKPLQQMEQQAQRMENLLKDLLWLARIESEENRLERKPVDVCGMLQELREELAEAYPQSPIELVLATDLRVAGDYRQLYSAVSNLAINAIKYSVDNSPVTIHWYLDRDKPCLSVRDRGIGIDASHIPRLTERFYRVDDSRSSATGGTGLGLAIVKHVAAAHGAQLLIESKLGEGSKFTLVFPVRPCQ